MVRNREMSPLGEGTNGVVTRVERHGSADADHAVKMFRGDRRHLIESALSAYGMCAQAGLRVPAYFRRLPDGSGIVMPDLSYRGNRAVVSANNESFTIPEQFRIARIANLSGFAALLVQQAQRAGDAQIELFGNAYLFSLAISAVPECDVVVGDFEAVRRDTNVSATDMRRHDLRYAHSAAVYVIEHLPYESDEARAADLGSFEIEWQAAVSRLDGQGGGSTLGA